MIKIARRLEKYHLAWLEDMLPLVFDRPVRGAEARHHGPIATGRICTWRSHLNRFFQAGVLDVVHPDLLTSGGILETKKLGDLAARYGASMALHMCESPVSALAGAHMATASENFFAQEHDAI